MKLTPMPTRIGVFACQGLFPGFDVRERVLIFELDMRMWSDEGNID